MLFILGPSTTKSEVVTLYYSGALTSGTRGSLTNSTSFDAPSAISGWMRYEDGASADGSGFDILKDFSFTLSHESQPVWSVSNVASEYGTLKVLNDSSFGWPPGSGIKDEFSIREQRDIIYSYSPNGGEVRGGHPVTPAYADANYWLVANGFSVVPEFVDVNLSFRDPSAQVLNNEVTPSIGFDLSQFSDRQLTMRMKVSTGNEVLLFYSVTSAQIVPEPSTACCFLTGASVIGLFRRRRGDRSKLQVES